MAVTSRHGYRVQDKGYKHKGWKERDLDQLPSREPMPPRHRQWQTPEREQNIARDIHVRRKINIYSELFSAVDIFLDEASDEAYLLFKRSTRTKVYNARDLSVTYFGNLAISAAIEDSSLPVYRNFGKDLRQTKYILKGLKQSFNHFMMDVSATYIDSKLDEVDEDDPSLLVVNTDEIAPDWTQVRARVSNTITPLQAGRSIYWALDLDDNNVLIEEKEAIRDHFRTADGLRIRDAEHSMNGEYMQDIMHMTFAKLPLSSVRGRTPQFYDPPAYVDLAPPTMSANAWIEKVRR